MIVYTVPSPVLPSRELILRCTDASTAADSEAFGRMDDEVVACSGLKKKTIRDLQRIGVCGRFYEEVSDDDDDGYDDDDDNNDEGDGDDGATRR